MSYSIASKILVVEDESAIAENIQFALEAEGFSVFCLQTGTPVIPLLQLEPIALVLLDIGLPDINGFELCKQIRKQWSTPIVFLTARSDEIDKVVGLEIGGDDYIVKPFSPRELTARVKAVLRRTDSRKAQTVSDQTLFQIDSDRRTILFCGEGLELSRYEFDLLALLIEHPGRVYSREQLMDNVWAEPELILERTVDAHIKNIRAKLRQVNPEIDPIVTYRGVGYAMTEKV